MTCESLGVSEAIGGWIVLFWSIFMHSSCCVVSCSHAEPIGCHTLCRKETPKLVLLMLLVLCMFDSIAGGVQFKANTRNDTSCVWFQENRNRN